MSDDSDDDDNPSNRAPSEALRRHLEATGNVLSDDLRKGMLKDFVRRTLFAVCPFPQDEAMLPSGIISTLVRNHLGANADTWEAQWEKWACRQTRVTLLAKRNSLQQILQGAITKGKKVCEPTN